LSKIASYRIVGHTYDRNTKTLSATVQFRSADAFVTGRFKTVCDGLDLVGATIKSSDSAHTGLPHVEFVTSTRMVVFRAWNDSAGPFYPLHFVDVLLKFQIQDTSTLKSGVTWPLSIEDIELTDVHQELYIVSFDLAGSNDIMVKYGITGEVVNPLEQARFNNGYTHPDLYRIVDPQQPSSVPGREDELLPRSFNLGIHQFNSYRTTHVHTHDEESEDSEVP